MPDFVLDLYIVVYRSNFLSFMNNRNSTNKMTADYESGMKYSIEWVVLNQEWHD